jgi:hypothetical protein
LVQLCFIKKNGQRRYKYLVLGRDRSYFVKHQSDSTKKLSETDIFNMLEFLSSDLWWYFVRCCLKSSRQVGHTYNVLFMNDHYIVRKSSLTSKNLTGQQTLNFHYWGVFFFPCEKRAKKKIDFSNVKWWAPYSWGTHLSMYSPYSQPYLSGFMLINLKMYLLHSERFLLVRLLLRPM